MSKQERIFGNLMVTLIGGLLVYSFVHALFGAYQDRSIASLRFLSGAPGRGEAMTEFDHLDY